MYMKFECIYPNWPRKLIQHVTSSELKEIKMEGDKGTSFLVLLYNYIENYCTEHGFKVIHVEKENFYIQKE